jgi:hypothetical protein
MSRSRSSSPKPKKPVHRQPEEEALREEIKNERAVYLLEGFLKVALTEEGSASRLIRICSYLRNFSKVVRQQSTVLKALELAKIPCEIKNAEQHRLFFKDEVNSRNTEYVNGLLDGDFINDLWLHNLKNGIIATISTHWGVEGKRVHHLQ